MVNPTEINKSADISTFEIIDKVRIETALFGLRRKKCPLFALSILKNRANKKGQK